MRSWTWLDPLIYEKAVAVPGRGQENWRALKNAEWLSEQLCSCSRHSNWSSRSMTDNVQVLKKVGNYQKCTNKWRYVVLEWKEVATAAVCECFLDGDRAVSWKH